MPHPSLLHPESLPYGRLLLTHTSAGDSDTGLAQTQDGVVEGRVLFRSPASWCPQGFASALQESVSPVLCKFWQLYSAVNGDLLQDLLQPLILPVKHKRMSVNDNDFGSLKTVI